jgi:hypothetical protein
MMKVNSNHGEGIMSKSKAFVVTGMILLSLAVSALGCRESGDDDGTGGSAGPTPTPISAPVSTLVIDDFLWKPVSDSDGKLAVLVNPFGARIDVNGAISETLRPIGPGNGRGSTGRGSFPGCAFGNNVTVEVFDRTGARIRLKDGRDFITVPFGCSRFEFKL